MKKNIAIISILGALVVCFAFVEGSWNSKFLHINSQGHIVYHPDEEGNTIPDFSAVGYHHGYKKIPVVEAVKTLSPIDGDDGEMIQKAINEVANMPLNNDGFRGAVLLKKGIYEIAGSLIIDKSGIVLRGEGDNTNGTVLIATGKNQRSLVKVSGKNGLKEVSGSRNLVTDKFVPVGVKSFNVKKANAYNPGDRIILYRPGTDQWINDLKMNQIVEGKGTIQWTAKAYNLSYEREIVAVKGNKITIDNPVVMQLEEKYGGGEIFKYTYEGRLSEIGIENILFKSNFATDTDEDHGWIAVAMNHIENGWVKQVTSRYFGYSCVSLGTGAKNITVTDDKIDTERLMNAQQNLFLNLETTEGRHDYVTGAKTCGPNVFYNCKARNTYSDIGPHHRWSSGTLYDNIDSDGPLNIQDRGDWGTGHGWAGVTQVVWNCKVSGAAIQKPWVSGTNYVIGLQGMQLKGRLNDRLMGEWEGLNKKELSPASLFLAQLSSRKN